MMHTASEFKLNRKLRKLVRRFTAVFSIDSFPSLDENSNNLVTVATTEKGKLVQCHQNIYPCLIVILDEE